MRHKHWPRSLWRTFFNFFNFNNPCLYETFTKPPPKGGFIRAQTCGHPPLTHTWEDIKSVVGILESCNATLLHHSSFALHREQYVNLRSANRKEAENFIDACEIIGIIFVSRVELLTVPICASICASSIDFDMTRHHKFFTELLTQQRIIGIFHSMRLTAVMVRLINRQIS